MLGGLIGDDDDRIDDPAVGVGDGFGTSEICASFSLGVCLVLLTRPLKKTVPTRPIPNTTKNKGRSFFFLNFIRTR